MTRGKWARVVATAMAALAVALAAGATLPDGATAQTTETPATVLPANPSTCTARTLGVSRASNPGLAADCDTLLAIKSTLRASGWIDYDAPAWRDHSYALNWSARSPLTHWRAVTLGGTPLRVTGLDFSDTRESVRVRNARTRRWEAVQPYTREWTLRGVIPTQLGTLTALETLDLGGGELTGAIPTQLEALTQLTRLDLSDNALSGSLPAGLRDLPPTLGTLRLAGNALTGCVDERLRLATTHDLATLMTARSLSWCPVTEAPNEQPLVAGTYHIDNELIIDVPENGPRVKLFAIIIASVSGGGGGVYHCLSDVGEQQNVCFSAHTAEEGVRGPARRTNRPGASSPGAGPAGLDTVFDEIAATARPAP